MKKPALLIPGLFVMLGSLSGCLGVSNSTSTDPYYGAWYDAYGKNCGTYNPQPGCDYYANGLKIQIYQDPYYYYGVSFSNGFWTSPDGITYTDTGYALSNQNENADVSADVIGHAAALEKQLTIKVGKEFAQK